MMTTIQRRLVALVALAAGAGSAYAAAVAYERRYALSQRASEQARQLIDCKQPIVSVRLERRNETILIERDVVQDANGSDLAAGPASWRLVLPLAARGDATTVEALVGGLCELQSLGRLEAKANEPPLSPAHFGLQPPKASVTVTDSSGHEQRLWVGDKSEFDGSLYVQTRSAPAAAAAGDANGDDAAGELAIHRVDGGLSFQLERDAFALRDKRLLTVGGEAIREVRVVHHKFAGGEASPRTTSTSRGFSLRRRDDNTFEVRGDEDGDNAPGLSADASEVAQLFDALTNLRAKTFVDEAPAPTSLSRFALAQPTFEVLLSVQGQTAPVAIRLGRLVLGDEPHYFAQVGEKTSPVAEVECGTLVDKLSHGEGGLRDMRVLHLASDDVVHLRIWDSPAANTTSEPLHLVRAAANTQPNGRPRWQLEGDPNFELDTSAVQGLVYRLASLRADTLGTENATPEALAASKLDAPAWRVAFGDPNDAILATLRLGREAGGRRPAVGNDGPLGMVFANVADGLSADANHFAPVAPMR